MKCTFNNKFFDYYEQDRNYRLVCGSYKELNNIENLDFIFTSPPYNIGSKCPKKITNRRNGGYDSKSWGSIEHYQDSMPEDEYQDWQTDFLRWCWNKIDDNGVIAYNHKDRHRNGRLITPEQWFPSELILFDKIVWDRKSTHNHEKSYAYQQHEFIYCFRKSLNHKHYFNKEMGLSSVVSIPTDKNNPHNAPFPLPLCDLMLKKFSKPGGIVCDPFAGSATTMIAAHKNRMSFIGTEIKPEYYKMGVERFKKTCL